MFAIIAAVLFGLALLLDIIGGDFGAAITPNTLMLAGLLFVALHLAGFGGGAPGRRWGRRR